MFQQPLSHPPVGAGCWGSTQMFTAASHLPLLWAVGAGCRQMIRAGKQQLSGQLRQVKDLDSRIG